jgi:hypothetical protein
MSSVQDFFRKYLQLKEHALTHSIDLVKHTTSVSAGVLAIIVAIGEAQHHSTLFFYLGLCLNSASVLFGVLFLSLSSEGYRKMDKDFQKNLLQKMRNNHNEDKLISMPFFGLMKWCERLTYAFFLAGLLCLVSNSFFID